MPRSLSKRPIVVGLLLNGQEEDFLRSIASLAHKLESPLELVHVLEGSTYSAGPSDLGINPFFVYERALSDMDEARARRDLEQIKSRLPASLTIRLHVLRDYPSAALCALAAETRAGLIVSGVQAPMGIQLFSGLSTAFALASHADIPVLLLPSCRIFDFSLQHKLLIADDLEIEGRLALENALLLAEDLLAPSLIHAHVHPRTREDIAGLLTHIEAEMRHELVRATPRLAPEHYIELLTQRIQDDLIYRFHNSEGAQQLAATYETRIGFGDAAHELHNLLQETGARLLVFGRHHLIHRRGFSLGKVPYPAMIQDSVATFIVPDTERYTLSRSR